MSLLVKSTQTVEQVLNSLQNVQDAGFRAALAVAERAPSVPKVVARSAERLDTSWVEGYFGLAQRILDGEKNTAEQFVALFESLLSNDVDESADGSLQAV